jgi:hypothetical protein
MVDSLSEDRFDEMDPVLRDMVPFLSDISFVRTEYRKAKASSDPVGYITELMEKESGSRKVDLRILLNRMERRWSDLTA